MKRYIPNIITLLNLLCGCIALVCIFYHEFFAVFAVMLVAFLADFFDGAAARLLKVHSEMGAELDSLADMISFGMVPGAIMYVLLANAFEPDTHLVSGLTWAAIPGFLVTVFSALRLGKFNLDTRQSSGFMGLATPASTVYILGLYLIYYHNPMGLRDLAGSPWLLYTSTIAICYLLIADIPMFSFKYKHMKWRGNEVRFIYISLCVILLVTLQLVSIPILVFLYVLISIISHVLGKNITAETPSAEGALQ
ncbi:MAG: CDP-alcohol phosphatidyltransferase family protein [Bacteroidota bacterium]